MTNTGLLPALNRRIIVPHTVQIPRSGEGSASALKDGTILFIHNQFRGSGADHDSACLFGGILDPLTGEIRDGRVILEDRDAVNQINPGLERLVNGDLGIIFLRRTAKDEDDLFFSRSADEGRTWSRPVQVNTCCEEKFIVVNNDRFRRLSSGRLAIPAALYPDRGDKSRPCSLAMFYSDDDGVTWTISERIKILDKNLTPPHAMHPDAGQAWKDGCDYYAKEQEPGVEELADGRLLLYCRTFVAYMYQSFSSDGGTSWTELKAATDIVSPCSPQSIRRIPGSRRLLCVFNNRRHIAFGDAEHFWHARTPLTLAASDDDAATWQVLGNLEDESHDHCYTSMLFFENKLLLTYYESENSIQDGKPVRRALASLKMQILDLKPAKGLRASRSKAYPRMTPINANRMR